MHVVMVAENYLTDLETGTGFARPQREELERRGHDVTVITNHRPDVSHGDSKVVEVPAIRLPGPSGTAVALPGLGQVDSILARADVIQAYEPLMLGQWAAKRAAHYGLSSIYVHHPYQALSQADVAVINQFGAVAAPTPSDLDAFTVAGITAPIYPIVYGVLARQSAPTDPHALHRQLGLALDVPIALYAGPLTSAANVPLLVDALLPIDHPLHFVIAADGPDRRATEVHIGSRNAGQRVHLRSAFGREERGIYGTAAIALSAGGDAHPTWLVEAASYGVPVVAIRAAETEHAVRSRATGILTLPTKTALTRAVMQLLHRPALRHRYGQTAKEHAATFSVERSVDQLLDIYALQRRLQHIEG